MHEYNVYQVTKNILYETVGDIYELKAIGSVKSKETRSYQKGRCNSPISSTQTTHALEMAKHKTITFSLLIGPCFLAFYTTNCLQILYTTNLLVENVFSY